jgi:tetratricopeptide (TPR) repeat protein
MGNSSDVRVKQETIAIPTYLPARPDRNPMFLEKRVYQGSSGKVYPLPFTDRIAEKAVDRDWRAIWIENAFLRVLVLPEIGGRIHAIIDKTNGYELIYYQRVIKPALVGLAGPWISGGIEFNWPQHHRPATFLPVDVEVEECKDGSKIVWCSDHDAMCRMKGMHGICLHSEGAFLELKVRVYNRTPMVQTFLWWANVATRVHEAYQSFFPPDVYCVADHARRSMSEYPLARGVYYGVNYGERGRTGIPPNEIPSQFVPPHCRPSGNSDQKSKIPNYEPNDLSFYANIPTPCSYMCTGSRKNFFGGYDYVAQAGIVHIANHHISPGKKQWTWGNHEFGYAWDRNLTERDSRGEFGPYLELMAGVYTDNQPDFSFLQPGETKIWSQFWYPIQKIGPAHHANLDAAVSLDLLAPDAVRRSSGRTKPADHFLDQRTIVRVGVATTRRFTNARVVLSGKNQNLAARKRNLTPGDPLVYETRLPRGLKHTDLQLRVLDSHGREIISFQPQARTKGEIPPPATEPPAPENIAHADELYLTGLHLEQYRHATRCPTLYWREALRRDPLDARCNNALGLWHLRRGEYALAETRFRQAIARLTRLNANPYDGEAYYNLGMCLRYTLDFTDDNSGAQFDEAYAAFYKATWNQAWAAAGYHALAELDCRNAHWGIALDHLNRSLRLNAENLRVRNLLALVLRRLGRTAEADAAVEDTLALDPMDWWARTLAGHEPNCDAQVRLDLAHDFARAGFYQEAIALLQTGFTPPRELLDQGWGAEPMVHYSLGWLYQKVGDARLSLTAFKRARLSPADYCFPSRLEEIGVLELAMRINRKDSRAPYYLGNLLYDRRRYPEAIRLWERSAKLDPGFSIVWRNLGIGYFNVQRNPAKARTAYNHAMRANPSDGRVLFERDQLWKRLGEKPSRRLRELEQYPNLVAERDDLALELCALRNQVGRPYEAARLLGSRRFQPWEGGEGGPLAQYVRAQLLLGRTELEAHHYLRAIDNFSRALTSPANLGEARHLLANQSEVHYWLGIANELAGDAKSARHYWTLAAEFRGDFQEMNARRFSEMTFYSALSLARLGHQSKAKELLTDLLACAQKLQHTPATIDYFATSLPAMLLFEDDLQSRQETTACFLQAQAHFGLGNRAQAQSLLTAVLQRDPNHALAADLAAELSRLPKPKLSHYQAP